MNSAACNEALTALATAVPATPRWLSGMHTLSAWAADAWPPAGPGGCLPEPDAAFVGHALAVLVSLWCDTPIANMTPVSDERIIGDVEFDARVDKIRDEIEAERRLRSAAAAAAAAGGEPHEGAPATFIPAAIQYDYELVGCTPAQIEAVKSYRATRDAAISGELGNAAALTSLTEARAAYDAREAAAAGWSDPANVLNATEDVALSTLPGTLSGCLVAGHRFTVGMYYTRLYLILFMLRAVPGVIAGGTDTSVGTASIGALTTALEAFATPPSPPLSPARIRHFEALLWRAGVLLHTPAAVSPAAWDNPIYASRERGASTIAWLALLAARLQRLVGDVTLYRTLSALPRWSPPPLATALTTVFNGWLSSRVATSLLPHIVTEAAFGALLSESLLPGDGDIVHAAAFALDAFVDAFTEDELQGQTSEFTTRTAKFVASSINRPLVASAFATARRGISAVLGLPPPSAAGTIALLDFILGRGVPGYRFQVPAGDTAHGICARVGNWGLLASAALVPTDDSASAPAIVRAGAAYFVVVGGAATAPNPSLPAAFCAWLAHIATGPADGFLHNTPSFVYGSGPEGFAFMRDPTSTRIINMRTVFSDLFEMARLVPGGAVGASSASSLAPADLATLAAEREIRRSGRAIAERDTLYGAHKNSPQN